MGLDPRPPEPVATESQTVDNVFAARCRHLPMHALANVATIVVQPSRLHNGLQWKCSRDGCTTKQHAETVPQHSTSVARLIDPPGQEPVTHALMTRGSRP